jgi:hypothetical protein
VGTVVIACDTPCTFPASGREDFYPAAPRPNPSREGKRRQTPKGKAPFPELFKITFFFPLLYHHWSFF